MQVLQLNDQTKIILKTSTGIKIINLESILYISADSNYSQFFLKDENPIMVSISLKYIAQLLTPFPFLRCHRACVVNLSHIKEYNYAGRPSLIITDKHKIPVSREGLKRLKDLIGLSE